MLKKTYFSIALLLITPFLIFCKNEPDYRVPYLLFSMIEKARQQEKISPEGKNKQKQEEFFKSTLEKENTAYLDGTKKLSSIKEMNLNKFSPNELETLSTQETSLKKIKEKIINHGFSKNFANKITAPAVVGLLNIAITWKEAGEKTSIKKNEKLYDAFKLKKYFKIYKTKIVKTIVELETAQQKDTVYIIPADQMNKIKGSDIISKLNRLNKQKKNGAWKRVRSYTSVTTPMVNYEQENDDLFLTGIRLGKQKKVERAILAVKLKMNELGARVKAAGAIMFKSIRRKKELTIDKPFYFVLMRKGLKLPVAIIHCDKESWKKPDSINN